MNQRISFFLLVMYFQNLVISLTLCQNKVYSDISKLVKNYKRPLTVLEVFHKDSVYSLPLVKNHKLVTVCAVCLSENYPKIIHAIKANKLQRITVLAPRLKLKDLFAPLSKCEHFDIVIVHDVVDMLLKHNVVTDILNLGEHVFFEVPLKSYNLISSKLRQCNGTESREQDVAVMHIYRPKRFLPWARWTQKYYPPTEQKKYRIMSNYSHKLLFKAGERQPTCWKAGINLVSYIMLCGIYPIDRVICHELACLYQKFPNHNDFVLGNVIVQGSHLDLIDFNDKRRDENSAVCLNAALELFQGHFGNRYHDPESTIYKYYNRIENYKIN